MIVFLSFSNIFVSNYYCFLLTFISVVPDRRYDNNSGLFLNFVYSSYIILKNVSTALTDGVPCNNRTDIDIRVMRKNLPQCKVGHCVNVSSDAVLSFAGTDIELDSTVPVEKSDASWRNSYQCLDFSAMKNVSSEYCTSMGNRLNVITHLYPIFFRILS